MTTTSTVIVLHLIFFTGDESVVDALPVETTLSYDAGDPWAVLITFDVGEDKAVKWRLDRGVLAAGLNAESGEGDVRVWAASEQDIVIRLSNADHACMFRAPADEVGAFLDSTYRLVPDGAEPGYLNIDTELDDLLGGDQPS